MHNLAMPYLIVYVVVPDLYISSRIFFSVLPDLMPLIIFLHTHPGGQMTCGPEDRGGSRVIDTIAHVVIIFFSRKLLVINCNPSRSRA